MVISNVSYSNHSVHIIYDFEVTMKDLDLSQLLPLRFQRCYQLKNTPEFFKEELLVHIYTTRNVAQLPIISGVTFKEL